MSDRQEWQSRQLDDVGMQDIDVSFSDGTLGHVTQPINSDLPAEASRLFGYVP